MKQLIKIEDFIEKLNNLDLKENTKIKFLDKIYLYDYPNLTGIYEMGKPTKKEYSLFAQLDITNLHCLIEIIEEDEEKEKNKELENADLTTVYMNGFYDGEKKWKDKIREKIKKIDNEEKEAQESISDEERKEYEDASIGYLLADIETRRRVLQELLEE